MQLIQLPWLPSTEVTKTAKHYGYRLSGLALTVMLLSACNSEDGFSSDDSYNLTVDGETALIVAQTGQLHAVASHSDSSDIDVTDKITWTSSSPSVVSIDEEGHYQALEVGSAVLEGVYQGEVVETKEVEVMDSYSITFPVTAATAIDVDIEHNNDAMVVDWGDGSSCQLDDITEIQDCSEHLYTEQYTGEITLRAVTQPDLISFTAKGPFSFDLAYLNQVAPELKTFAIDNLEEPSKVHGELIDLPKGLVEVSINTGTDGAYFSGSERDFPTQIKKISVGNFSVKGGVNIDISNLVNIAPDLESLTVGSFFYPIGVAPEGDVNNIDIVTGDLNTLNSLRNIRELTLRGNLASLEGSISDLRDLSLTVLTIRPYDSNTLIAGGSFLDIPETVTTLDVKDVPGMYGITNLDTQKSYDVLRIEEWDWNDINKINEIKIADGGELIVRSKWTGALDNFKRLPKVTVIAANQSYDPVDLTSFFKTLENDNFESFNLLDASHIDLDLSSLKRFTGHSFWLKSNSGVVTGNLNDIPACQLEVPKTCYLSISVPNNISGDLGEFISRLEGNDTIKYTHILFRQGGQIELSSSAPLNTLRKLEILGDGMSQSSVNNIFIGLNRNGIFDGSVILGNMTHTNNPPPTGAGLLAAQSLEAKGWDVCYTGKPGC